MTPSPGRSRAPSIGDLFLVDVTTRMTVVEAAHLIELRAAVAALE